MVSTAADLSAARLAAARHGSYDTAVVAREDVGNLLRLEHVNLFVPSMDTAILFYVLGLGLTRDPHFLVGTDNMWINAGDTQFHLPVKTPAQVLRGHVVLVLPDLDGLVSRLATVKARLAGTRFAWTRRKGEVRITCPWGNDYRCIEPAPRYPGLRRGIGCVQLDVPVGVAAPVGRFYRQVMDCPVALTRQRGLARAAVRIGGNQDLVFQETRAAVPDFDGHHIAVYAANMSKAFAWLHARGAVMEGLYRHQYRFKDIVDPDSGQVVFELEHEVRSSLHPMFMRPLVNRDPALDTARFSGGDRPVPTLHWGP